MSIAPAACIPGDPGGAPDGSTGPSPSDDAAADGDPDAPDGATVPCEPPFDLDAVAQTLASWFVPDDDAPVDQENPKRHFHGIITGGFARGTTDATDDGAYLTVRFDVPLSGCKQRVSFVGVFQPDPVPGARTLVPATDIAGFPFVFDDGRLEARALFARAIATSFSGFSSLLDTYAASLGVTAGGLPSITLPTSPHCKTLLDLAVACEDDELVATNHGLSIDFELDTLQSEHHAITGDIASDLLVGQHDSESRWSLEVRVPAPGTGDPAYAHVAPAVVARVFAHVGAVAVARDAKDAPGDVFDAFDVMGTLALARIDGALDPSRYLPPGDDAKKTYAAHESALGLLPTIAPMAADDAPFSLAAVPTDNVWGCQ